MEILNYFVQNLHIDIFIMILVFAAGFFQARYLGDIKGSSALKTLVVSFIFSVIYIILLKVAGNFQRENSAIYFISYCVATSFYEILIKPFLNALKIDLNKRIQE
jgi:hypothetical protein